jgi:hypothetical protein
MKKRVEGEESSSFATMQKTTFLRLRETRWNIPDGLTEEPRDASTDGSPYAPKEYSTHDIGDHISSPTRQTRCRQFPEMIFHPSGKKFAFFFTTNLIPSSKTHFSRRLFGIKRYIIEALTFLDRLSYPPNEFFWRPYAPLIQFFSI